MASNQFEGMTLPFTQRGWLRQFASGTFRNGASWKHVEKVRTLGVGTMGAKLEDVHIIASLDVDQGGNKITNTRKGQHFLRLRKGVDELAFAVHDGKVWRILAYNCSCFAVVKTQGEAEEALAAINWRKWANAGSGSRNIKTPE